VVIAPVYRISMLEANQPLPASSPLVVRFAELLEKLTAGFVEDAPRIVDLTVRATMAIRATKQPASPLEIMEAALAWDRAPRTVRTTPRSFENYIATYRKLRIKEKKDHAQTLGLMHVPAPTPTPPPPPTPATRP
jgi:hypothetical protein